MVTAFDICVASLRKITPVMKAKQDKVASQFYFTVNNNVEVVL